MITTLINEPDHYEQRVIGSGLGLGLGLGLGRLIINWVGTFFGEYKSLNVQCNFDLNQLLKFFIEDTNFIPRLVHLPLCRKRFQNAKKSLHLWRPNCGVKYPPLIRTELTNSTNTVFKTLIHPAF